MRFTELLRDIKRFQKKDGIRKLCSEVDLLFLEKLSPSMGSHYLRLLKYSKAQCRQDLIALAFHEFKEQGHYVEIGAADGVYLSNTLLLNKAFGWNGVLVEPSRRFKNKIVRNRPSDQIDFRAVSSGGTNQVTFYESFIPELSTVEQNYQDGWKVLRSKVRSTYLVETVTLAELLNSLHSIRTIDFLSIDAEGHELEIISTLEDVQKKIELISIEHSHISEKRDQIRKKLTACGFSKLELHTELWDDWYFSTSMRSKLSRIGFA